MSNYNYYALVLKLDLLRSAGSTDLASVDLSGKSQRAIEIMYQYLVLIIHIMHY
jgi:hypothetical protein